ncbi:molybdopterin-dependent oxidoreductase, partial [Escherichia coli]|nr:molybdopterin-dependent oxidoreductase [Escherichia coli]
LTARAIAMLPILTGNVGISGGNSGARESTYTITIERLPVLDNPVKTSISCFSWTDAIDHGPQMTAIRDGVRGKDKLDVPIKFIWNYKDLKRLLVRVTSGYSLESRAVTR